MWCVIVTMTTVGYGDFYPVTHLGRIVGVIASLWGAFIISLLMVTLSTNTYLVNVHAAIATELTPAQRKAYDLICLLYTSDAADE